MLKQIPVSLVLAVAVLIFAEWPSVQSWGDATTLHHYVTHLLYVFAGALVGWQTSEWASSPAHISSKEAGVSS